MQINTEKIKIEMIRLGWNQQDLADKLNITRQAVSYFLKQYRSPSLAIITRYAEALDINPKDLIIN